MTPHPVAREKAVQRESLQGNRNREIDDAGGETLVTTHKNVESGYNQPVKPRFRDKYNRCLYTELNLATMPPFSGLPTRVGQYGIQRNDGMDRGLPEERQTFRHGRLQRTKRIKSKRIKCRLTRRYNVALS